MRTDQCTCLPAFTTRSSVKFETEAEYEIEIVENLSVQNVRGLWMDSCVIIMFQELPSLFIYLFFVRLF